MPWMESVNNLQCTISMMKRKIQIAPSILSADFGKLNEEIREIEKYVDRIHVDVMDGHFVANISFGAPVMKWITSKLPKDVHLMIEHPWKYFEDFANAGGDTLIVHSEVCSKLGSENDLPSVLKKIKKLGACVGISIKPKTGVKVVAPYLKMIDQVLIMTVEPGFGGQDFMPEMVSKIGELRALRYQGDIGVDGGINDKTASICVEAGANLLIAGNYVFGARDRVERIRSLKF